MSLDVNAMVQAGTMENSECNLCGGGLYGYGACRSEPVKNQQIN
jgi:hypothetical protein